MDNTKFLRGFVKDIPYGTAISLHKDAVDQMKLQGDYYKFVIRQKKDKSGYYMKEDEFVPKEGYKKPNNSDWQQPTVDNSTDGLPF